MYKNNVDMRVLVNGRPVREYPHRGMTFIESRHGSNYSIKIKNDNGNRVMAVVSVDGLDVITGKPAEKTNKGYIVDAYSSTEIKGYRLSDTDSAAFVFVSKDKSYVANAAQGDKRNSGVIGIRVFEEKPEKVKVIEKHIHHNHYPVNPWNPYPVIPPQPYWYSTTTYTTGGITGSSTAGGMAIGATLNSNGAVGAYNVSVSNASLGSGQATCASNNLSYSVDGECVSKGLISPGVSARSVDNSIKNDFDAAITTDSFDTGTGWGEKQVDKVKKEYFRKGKMVGELVLYYASTDALIDMGVDLSTTPTIAEVTKKKLPSAFGDGEYCQPPKGWQGNR